VVREPAVDVEGAAQASIRAIFVETQPDAAEREVLRLRRLGLEVDIAPRPAPAVVRGRPLDDLDLLEVEGIAGEVSRVAHTVDEDVTAGAEAPQAEIVGIAA